MGACLFNVTFMRYFYSICFVLFFLLPQMTMGQVRNLPKLIDYELIVYNPSYEIPGFVGYVVGVGNYGGLPYARVCLIDGKDTVKLACDGIGSFCWKTDHLPDTVLVRVSATGFKTLEKKCAPRDGRYLRPQLKQEVERLNEVTVLPDRVRVTLGGDTLEFQSGGLKTFEGDFMGNFLRSLPGFSIDNGSLTVNGQLIHRVNLGSTEDYKNLQEYLVARSQEEGDQPRASRKKNKRDRKKKH